MPDALFAMKPPRPAPGLQFATYDEWAEFIWPYFEYVATTDRTWTVFEVKDEFGLPEPPKPDCHWGHFSQRLDGRRKIATQVNTDRSKRRTSNRSRVATWRGVKPPELGAA